MIVFKDKVELMEFFTFVMDKLDKGLGDSGFQVDLSIIPLDTGNLRVVHDAFKAYEKSKEPSIVTPA